MLIARPVQLIPAGHSIKPFPAHSSESLWHSAHSGHFFIFARSKPDTLSTRVDIVAGPAVAIRHIPGLHLKIHLGQADDSETVLGRSIPGRTILSIVLLTLSFAATVRLGLG